MSYAGLPISFDSPTSSSVQNFSYTQPHLANKIVFSGQKPSDEFITDAPRQTNWPSFYRWQNPSTSNTGNEFLNSFVQAPVSEENIMSQFCCTSNTNFSNYPQQTAMNFYQKPYFWNQTQYQSSLHKQASLVPLAQELQVNRSIASVHKSNISQISFQENENNLAVNTQIRQHYYQQPPDFTYGNTSTVISTTPMQQQYYHSQATNFAQPFINSPRYPTQSSQTNREYRDSESVAQKTVSVPWWTLRNRIKAYTIFTGSIVNFKNNFQISRVNGDVVTVDAPKRHYGERIMRLENMSASQIRKMKFHFSACNLYRVKNGQKRRVNGPPYQPIQRRKRAKRSHLLTLNTN
ncbi:unnamed protein product [Dracunculus medinensis]|uniref:PSP1 C-terminal domain-containing protein n=1 Tax=Dracunculus medinensis TaxID=318479 RepID=A0A0N4U6B5_DRAME|nr:unnamed protein product [Dracunculus medinensis]